MMEADGKKVLLFIRCWDEEEGEEDDEKETPTLLCLEPVVRTLEALGKVEFSDVNQSQRS